MTYNPNPIVNAIDTNMDNIMTHEEWIAAGAPESSWQGFVRASGTPYITREQFLAETPPGGIDKNCDGYISIWEFRDTVTGCPPYREEGRTYDATPIVNAIDTNMDNIMTHEEWTRAGAPEPSWEMFMGMDKEKKGYITREEFLAESPPDTIDKNCDGYITIWEFRAFAQMGPPGGAPPGPPPQR